MKVEGLNFTTVFRVSGFGVSGGDVQTFCWAAGCSRSCRAVMLALRFAESVQ